MNWVEILRRIQGIQQIESLSDDGLEKLRDDIRRMRNELAHGATGPGEPGRARIVIQVARLLEKEAQYRVTTGRASQKSRHVRTPPGSILLSLLPWFFSRKTIEHTFMPALLDMRREYFDALTVNRKWLARAVYVRWLFGIVETVLLSWGVSLAKKIKAVWKLGG